MYAESFELEYGHSLQAAKLHGVRIMHELIGLLPCRVDVSVIMGAFQKCFPDSTPQPPVFCSRHSMHHLACEHDDLSAALQVQSCFGTDIEGCQSAAAGHGNILAPQVR